VEAVGAAAHAHGEPAVVLGRDEPARYRQAVDERSERCGDEAAHARILS
jgi:hypothetical protein